VATGTTNYGYDGDRLTGDSSNRFNSYWRIYALDAAFNRTGATGVSGTSPSWSRTLSGNTTNQVTGNALIFGDYTDLSSKRNLKPLAKCERLFC